MKCQSVKNTRTLANIRKAESDIIQTLLTYLQVSAIILAVAVVNSVTVLIIIEVIKYIKNQF